MPLTYHESDGPIPCCLDCKHFHEADSSSEVLRADYRWGVCDKIPGTGKTYGAYFCYRLLLRRSEPPKEE